MPYFLVLARMQVTCSEMKTSHANCGSKFMAQSNTMNKPNRGGTCYMKTGTGCETYFILFLPVYAANNCLRVLVDYRLETSSYLLVHCHLMNSFLMLLPVYTCTVHCLLIFLSWVKTESIMSFKGERQ